MIKKCLLLVVAIFMFASTANAHSVLVSSNPEEGQVINKQLKEIKMVFNTKVEKGGSFTLVDQDGKEYIPDTQEIDDKQVLLKFENPFVTNSYTLSWEIIGADGHMVDGAYDFNVEYQPPKKDTTDSVDPTPKESEKEGSQPNESAEKDNNTSTEKESTQGTNGQVNSSNEQEPDSDTIGMLPIVLIVLSGLVLFTLIILQFRKGKR